MYTVIELQDNEETVGVLSYSFHDEKSANQKYYEVLYYAAAGSIPIHSATLMNNGFFIKSDVIDNRAIPEPELETTTE